MKYKVGNKVRLKGPSMLHILGMPYYLSIRCGGLALHIIEVDDEGYLGYEDIILGESVRLIDDYIDHKVDEPDISYDRIGDRPYTFDGLHKKIRRAARLCP